MVNVTSVVLGPLVSDDRSHLDDPLNRARAGLGDHQAVRLELICRIRGMIASGQYDSDARLNAALDRLLDEMM